MKKLSKALSVLIALVIMLSTFSAYAVTGYVKVKHQYKMLKNNTVQSDGSLVFDEYDVLSEDEEQKLEAKLEEISQKHNMDIAVVIVYALDGKSPMAFADDYYDYNGYGQGDNADGAVLVLSMQYRDWWFSTSGKAINAFTDENQKKIFSSEMVLGYFKNDDWAGGLNSYANECDRCITAFENGREYKPFIFKEYIKYVGISAAISLVVALIFIGSVKNKHKTVRMKAGAGDYLVRDSLFITQSYDNFAYSNVSKVRRDTESKSGGSSTHTSSSGRSHGGSGGKF